MRARINNVELLDQAAAKTSMGLKIFLRDSKPLDSIAKRLATPPGAPAAGRAVAGKPVPEVASPRTGGGDGEVTLVMMLDLETEVEMKLPGRFKVSPQIAGALKAVTGVVDVQTV